MNTTKEPLTRVTRKQRCPICNKPDWCIITSEVAICMRVESDHKHVFKNGAEGWIHKLSEPLKNFTPEPRRDHPEIDVKKILAQWKGEGALTALAIKLGVSYKSLASLGCVWATEHKAFAFPMRGGTGEYRGIRLRSLNGDKWAVRGSKEGVFYPFGIPNDTTLFVVEGPTDCAAGLTLGLACAGRPSCHGGVDDIRQIVRNDKYRRVVVISDSDDIGRKGAMTLLNHLFVPRCLINLPTKDLRAFVKEGGARPELNYILDHTEWTKS